MHDYTCEGCGREIESTDFDYLCARCTPHELVEGDYCSAPDGYEKLDGYAQGGAYRRGRSVYG